MSIHWLEFTFGWFEWDAIVGKPLKHLIHNSNVAYGPLQLYL